MAPFAVLPVWPGLLLLSFSSCERERPWLASLFLVLGTMAWALVLAALPILFVSPAELAWQYGNWWVLHTTSTAASNRSQARSPGQNGSTAKGAMRAAKVGL